jgi:hypothetical protein
MCLAWPQNEYGLGRTEILRSSLVRQSNQRGTAEQWEGNNAVNGTWLSCRNFRNNQVRLQLISLANNLENVIRRWALPSLPTSVFA